MAHFSDILNLLYIIHGLHLNIHNTNVHNKGTVSKVRPVTVIHRQCVYMEIVYCGLQDAVGREVLPLGRDDTM